MYEEVVTAIFHRTNLGPRTKGYRTKGYRTNEGTRMVRINYSAENCRCWRLSSCHGLGYRDDDVKWVMSEQPPSTTTNKCTGYDMTQNVIGQNAPNRQAHSSTRRPKTPNTATESGTGDRNTTSPQTHIHVTQQLHYRYTCNTSHGTAHPKTHPTSLGAPRLRRVGG